MKYQNTNYLQTAKCKSLCFTLYTMLKLIVLTHTYIWNLLFFSYWYHEQNLSMLFSFLSNICTHIGIVTSTVWPLLPNFDNPSYISFHQFDFTKLELKRYFRIVFDTILVILSLKMRVFKKALPKTTFNIRFSIEDHRPSNHIRKTCMKVSK